MRRMVWLGMGAAGLVACEGGDRRLYDNNDLRLVTAYTAKDACSCLFVAEQDEAFCRAWVQARPAVAHLRIDAERKAVETSALLLWGARARFVDARTGCVLEE
ncbi:hypothetical protein [Stigmatella erecta]|uniref:Lipoprotein n=1 Tax=Stigmatella erecta TaxID=83460 RepID=A0A1I0KI41_9BACT|nr:hypothetical protein [Stigmatella erecta]SEU23409.1 hypothetical protein SAMN05443639_110247 [Stigmatella erecta]